MSTFSEETGVTTLMDMLSYRRPAGSKTERRFLRGFLKPLDMEIDKAGNLYKRIGDAPVLWSCHTDTVHNDGGRQKVVFARDAKDKRFVMLSKEERSNCLGADDTSGVFLMHEMIKAEVPGLYVFHRGEEIGGVGSTHISKHNTDLLKGIDFAIALDRTGTADVITHQGFGRCCSDEFGTALAKKLPGSYVIDDTGVFTDTANYTELVGECTNISVGYYAQHRPAETLDLEHIMTLRDCLRDFTVDGLPTVRKPGEMEYGGGHSWRNYYGTGTGCAKPSEFWSGWEKEDAWEKGVHTFSDEVKRSVSAINSNRGVLTKLDSPRVFDQRCMSDVVGDFPDEVADILCEFGFDLGMLLRELESRGVPIESLYEDFDNDRD